MRICEWLFLSLPLSCLRVFLNRIRFTPPLVISEEDLADAVKIIGECLVDINVLDEIPGDEPVR